MKDIAKSRRKEKRGGKINLEIPLKVPFHLNNDSVPIQVDIRIPNPGYRSPTHGPKQDEIELKTGIPCLPA
jgi:hypothetical protein